MNKPKLLFYGDLAPDYLSGTSIAARTNLDILSEKYSILHQQEDDDWTAHGQGTISKVIKIYRHGNSLKEKLLQNDVEIFYSHLPSSVGGLLKMLYLLLRVKASSKAKIVLHLHRGDYKSKYVCSQKFAKLSNLLLSKVDYLIVLSHQHRRSMEGVFPIKQTHVLENTIEKEYSFPEKSTKSNRSQFVFISNYILEKGIIDLLEVFSEIRKKHDVELHTYGNTFDKELFTKIEKYDKAKGITVNGPISGRQKFEVLSNADFFVLPSWNEGQPLVILEAMSQGTTVIASDVGFTKEMLGEDYPYLYEATNRDQLFRLLDNVITNGSLKDSIPLKERYKTTFSLKSHSEKLLQIFDNIQSHHTAKHLNKSMV